MEAAQSRKRPRPVVSCLRCRDKKLKCDRVTPCQNCIRVGCREECTYNQHPASDAPPKAKRAHVVNEVADDVSQSRRTAQGVGVIEDLQQRMAHLEALLAVKPGNSGPTGNTPVQPSWPQRETTTSYSPYLGTLVVKGSRTRYHGQNNRITLLNQFSEAKEFIYQSARDSSLVGLAKEVQFLQNKSQIAISTPESISGLDSFPELRALLNDLPSKAACDHLVQVYTQNFEKVFRIVHVPSFIRDYAFFWTGEDHSVSFLSMFVPLLTAVMCVAIMHNPSSPNPGDSPAWEYLKRPAVSNVQAWLQKLPRKHKIEFATLQTEALLFLSRKLRSVSSEELWKASGSLIRSAMTMGLHVNLSTTSALSPFQAECRRRLWITVVEMDLQASIVAGMPVMTPALDFSSLMPSNLDDEDFEPNSASLPSPKPLGEMTDSLSQIVLAGSLAQRIRAMNLLQHTTPHETIEERLQHGRKIIECLEQVPDVLKPETDVESVDPSTVLDHVIVDIFIRRPLLCLYRPVMTSEIHDDPRFAEFQRSCLESSTAILSYQDLFDPRVVDLDSANANAHWNIFQTFFQTDIIWGTLGICEYMKLMNHPSNSRSPVNDAPGHAINNTLYSKANLIRLAENTLDSLTRRIGAKGSNIKDVLLLSVVLQSARARGPAEQRENRMSQGARKALSACRQHLLSAVGDNELSYKAAEQLPMHLDTMTPSLSAPIPPTPAGMPEFLQQSSALAAEFVNFEPDLFAFDEDSITWTF